MKPFTIWTEHYIRWTIVFWDLSTQTNAIEYDWEYVADFTHIALQFPLQGKYYYPT